MINEQMARLFTFLKHHLWHSADGFMRRNDEHIVYHTYNIIH